MSIIINGMIFSGVYRAGATEPMTYFNRYRATLILKKQSRGEVFWFWC